MAFQSEISKGVLVENTTFQSETSTGVSIASTTFKFEINKEVSIGISIHNKYQRNINRKHGITI